MRVDRASNAAEVMSAKAEAHVRLNGWVVSKSTVGGVVFLLLRDGSGYVQLSAKKGTTPDSVFVAMKSATRESAVTAEGVVREDKRAPGGRELQVKDFTIIASAET